MRKGLAAALLLALAGCNVTPHKAYEGPARRDSELSFIRGGSKTTQTDQEYSPVSVVDLRVIDGAKQHRVEYLVSVLPGRHRVGLRETLRIGMRERTQYCLVELETAAGCAYTPTAPSPPADARVSREWDWNVDMVVSAECDNGAAFALRAPARCGSSDKVLEGMRK